MLPVESHYRVLVHCKVRLDSAWGGCKPGETGADTQIIAPWMCSYCNKVTSKTAEIFSTLLSTRRLEDGTVYSFFSSPNVRFLLGGKIGYWCEFNKNSPGYLGKMMEEGFL